MIKYHTQALLIDTKTEGQHPVLYSKKAFEQPFCQKFPSHSLADCGSSTVVFMTEYHRKIKKVHPFLHATGAH